MSDCPPKLDDLLSHRPLGRVLAADDVATEFALIRSAFVAAGKPTPTPSDFAMVGRASGTHLLKLVSARAEASQAVLRIRRPGANIHPSLTPSLDAKKAPVAKLVHRPLEIFGHPPKTLADHILNADELSPSVIRGFAASFGEDALRALSDALRNPLPPITRLPAREFPVVFLPRPGGGDVQATPLSRAQAYLDMDNLTASYFLKREPGQPSPPRGRWHMQDVSAKPRNISSAIGRRRTRFLASMPRVLDDRSAELHRFANRGVFPRWREDGVPEAIKRYADLLERSLGHSNRDIRSGLDRRADALIRAAQAFIAETIAETPRNGPGVDPPAWPKVIDVILRACRRGKDYDIARRALTSDHFIDRLRKAGA